MDNPVKERIEKLRGMMRRHQVSAFIIPSTDSHMSEYVASHWQAREWFSGFTGSAGTLVVTLNEAGLWTDSRYFLQAAEQLEGSGIDLYKDGLPETPDILTFLLTRLQPGESAGIEGQVFASSSACAWQSALKRRSIRLQDIARPFEGIWTDRPPLPEGKAFIHPLAYAGKSCEEKLGLIRQRMEEAGADAVAVCPPPFFRHGQPGIIRFMREVADRSVLPVYLYDIPAFTSPMSFDTIVQLSSHRNICVYAQ